MADLNTYHVRLRPPDGCDWPRVIRIKAEKVTPAQDPTHLWFYNGDKVVAAAHGVAAWWVVGAQEE